MAELFPVDQIMADPGLPDTLEYTLVQAGIPALTVELGGPRGFDREMIRIGVEGGDNLLTHYKMTDRPVGQTAKDRNVFRGNDLEDIPSVTGGFVELLVKLNDEVKKGQKVAIQRNAFGDVVHEYTAGVDGRVAIIGTEAIGERGVISSPSSRVQTAQPMVVLTMATTHNAFEPKLPDRFTQVYSLAGWRATSGIDAMRCSIE